MTTPEFRSSARRSYGVDKDRFIRRVHSLLETAGALHLRAVQLLQTAISKKEPSSSSGGLDLTIESAKCLELSRFATALIRLMTAERLYPSCPDPIQIFAGDRRSSIDLRVSALIRRHCQRRKLKVVVRSRIRPRLSSFCVSVILLREEEGHSRRLLSLVVNGMERLWHSFFPCRYTSQLTEPPRRHRRDCWLRFVSGGLWFMTGCFRGWAVSASVAGFVVSYSYGQVSVMWLGSALLLLTMGKYFGDAYYGVVAKRLQERLSNPGNY